MQLNRTENTKKNIKWGLLNKVIFLLFPFILRATIVRTVGAEFLGLDSLFVSVLQILSLAELGFSEAIVYSMYRPVANDDISLLGEILGFYRKVYRLVGLSILGIGLCILPFLHLFINGSYPAQINIYLLYGIYLFNTVISYWLFAYKQSVLNAYMQQYVVMNVNMVIRLITYIVQLAILFFLQDFYLYVFLIVLNTAANNIVLNYYVNKLHPNIKCCGKLCIEIKKDIFEKIKGLIIGKVTGVFRNAMDSVFVSVFIGLVSTGIFTNYFLILSGVQSFFMLLYESYAGGAGNSIVLESKSKNYRDLCYLNFIYMWLAGWGTICLCCLYQPFIKCIFGTDMLFSDNVMFLFCIYFYVLRIGDVLSLYARGNGLWWKERYRVISELLVNVLLTFILGNFFGVFGILLATILALLMCSSLWGAYITFKNYFHAGFKLYLWLHIKYFIWTLLVTFGIYGLCVQLTRDSSTELLDNLLICLIIPPIMYWFRYRHTKIYTYSMLWLSEHIHIPVVLKQILLNK